MSNDSNKSSVKDLIPNIPVSHWNLDTFRNPPSAYRIQPFWFWNGQMDDNEIRWQITEMHDKGIGGFFICARQGMDIPYLSDQWFAKVQLAVEQAAKYSMEVWLYDEYPYPSGIAGGEVILEHPDARHRTLVHTIHIVQEGETASIKLPWAKVLFAQAVPIVDDKGQYEQSIDLSSAIGSWQQQPVFQKTGLTAYNRKRFFTYDTVQRLEWTAPPGQWKITIIQEKELDEFKYYGTFVDPCHQEAMASFIRLTHERYAHHLKEYFGHTIKGMFTDEIGLLGKVPWSPQLVNAFHERCGYSLLDRLNTLFDPEAPDAKKVRYDYYQTIHILLRDVFHRQVHDWCEQYGLQYVAEVPSVRHTTQLYSHIPGGDSAHEKIGRSLDWILRKDAGHFRSNPRMVSSLARQLDRPRNLIECFHSVGWSMTMQDARWMIDRMSAMGTNFFNFHAFFYTLDGMTKHDAPPSQFYQSTYWRHFRWLADYAARISYVMSSGTAEHRIALLQPTASLWNRMGNPFHHFQYDGENKEEQKELELLHNCWKELSILLESEGWGFDHLDTEMLSIAEITEGYVVIGQARYEMIILPPTIEMESRALHRLIQFADQGGHVIMTGEWPHQMIIEPNDSDHRAASDELQQSKSKQQIKHSDWIQDLQMQKHSLLVAESWRSHSITEWRDALRQELLPLLDRYVRPVVSITYKQSESNSDHRSCLTQLRGMPDRTNLLFITNQEQARQSCNMIINLKQWMNSQSVPEANHGMSVSIYELHLETGERRLMVTRQLDTSLESYSSQNEQLSILHFQLSAYEARLFQIQFHIQKLAERSSHLSPSAFTLQLDASQGWTLQSPEHNMIRLDRFDWSVAYEQDGEPIMKASQLMVKTFIDQYADVTKNSTAALPLSLSQEFGTPVRSRIRYPLYVTYTAHVQIDDFSKPLHLVMDRSAILGSSSIRWNEQLLDQQEWDTYWLYDHSNIAQAVDAYLLPGKNKLQITVEVTEDWHGLTDAIYLIGDFHVQLPGERYEYHRIIPAVEQIHPIVTGPYPGMPYYAGTLVWEGNYELEQLPMKKEWALVWKQWDLHMHDPVEVIINGYSLGLRPWSPYEWSGERELLHIGSNSIQVKVDCSLIGLLEGAYFEEDTHSIVSFIKE